MRFDAYAFTRSYFQIYPGQCQDVYARGRSCVMNFIGIDMRAYTRFGMRLAGYNDHHVALTCYTCA